MDEKTALHTTARRYCIERAPAFDISRQERWYRDRRWHLDREIFRIWIEEEGTGTQREILGGILFVIEQISPEHFASVQDMRTFLINIANDETIFSSEAFDAATGGVSGKSAISAVY